MVTEEKRGLKIPRYFTKEGVNPFEMFTYRKRSSLIKNPDGSIVFSMDNVEVPDFWTQLATDILAQKYFRKAGIPQLDEKNQPRKDENGKLLTGSENSIKQVAHRIAGCWRYWGEKHGYFASELDAQVFYEEMVYMIINQTAAPNSPQWFNTGLNWAYGITGPAQGHSYVDPDTEKSEYSKDAYTRMQPHACFVQSIKDDLVGEGGIFSLLTREARVFKYGSGTGSNFSALRGKGESLAGGGSSSGLMSFLKIFDAAAGSIKSGGTTRRAAKMVCLDLDHPEIEDFIWWKVREEEKVADLVTGSRILKEKLQEVIKLAKNKDKPFEDEEILKSLKKAADSKIPINYLIRALNLAQQGYDLPLKEFDTHYESEAYVTVSGQNSNNSIRIPNSFFTALENGKEWQLKARITGKTMKTISAEKLWDDIGYCAWASADPGVQYDSTINEWHTCPEDGRINASNPCSEFMFIDDTACNLASINLVKLYHENRAEFDIKGYTHTIRLWTIALEISVLMAHFPSPEMAIKSHEFRALGLGFANIGTLLMLQSVPYDSEKSRAIAGALAAILTGEAYAVSAELANVLGVFKHYKKNQEQMLKVIRNHRRAAYNEAEDSYENLTIKPKALDQKICPQDLLQTARQAWDKALALGEKYGYRNAQVTVMAPTGTIALVMDCDTTGIEPDYSLIKYKKLAGGGFFKIVNNSVPKSLQRLGYNESQTKDIVFYCLGHGTFEGSPFINRETLKKRGLTEEQINRVENELRNAMDIRLVFNSFNLGESFYHEKVSGSEDFLKAIGFREEEIEAANEYICGTMTIEGAPFLKEEHYAIFDCANKCGKKGQRYIHPYGHLKMVSAVQSFISGAISKTINMPQDWTIEQIKKAYYDAWKMMIKGVALYRDGCKLSQPLNSTLEDNPELKKILEESKDYHEDDLKATSYIKKKVNVGKKRLMLTGTVKENKLKEVNVEMEDLTLPQEVIINALTNTINLSLNNGVGHSQIAEQSLNIKGHPLIEELSIFLQEFDEFQKPFKKKINDKKITEGKVIKDKIGQEDDRNLEEIACSFCGAVQLRPNGTCMLCEVCGETTGCS